MAENALEAPEGAETPKKSMLPLLMGLVLALGLGGGSAYAVMSGLLPLDFVEEALAGKPAADEKDEEAEPPVFVEFEPLTLTIGRADAARQLRLDFVVETTAAHAPLIETMRPRIIDALNTLLRALDESELSEPAALDRLRAQMARRIRVAVDPDSVRDLLITQYVIL